MILVAALPRRALLVVVLVLATATASLGLGLAWVHHAPPARPTSTSAVIRGVTAPGSAALSEQQASEAAAAFGQAYFSGGDVRSYLTAAEARAWTQQATASTPTGTTVSAVTATAEGPAADGSLGFIVDARMRLSEQAVEVFVVEQDGRYLIERVNP
jgi:hypothetical protein